MAQKNRMVIMSLGGSMIIPADGFNVSFLKSFRKMIMDRVKKGDKFILVVGGGGTCRAYQKAIKEAIGLSSTNLDWLGIYVTHLNAKFTRFLLSDIAHPEVITNPTRKIKTSKPVIIAGGWKPGCSTDKDAVLLAKVYGAKEVINVSNIDYVYTADPRKDSKAKPLPHLTWPEMRKIVGNKWNPGANVPFDPSAAKEAQKLGLKVSFVKGTNMVELKKAIGGLTTKGTVIE
ncbi:MAG: UMP kinase [Candidatus Magasanikbacteria bacterium CG10_big_fil_rev_8_21_14_0_10_36_32]|uniref:UMP kinase n=1 Tax=Candidatus Magasanikbacteria bacterium CG10_big_fil_rev_8_21_14_0_10_36_32 TaxID=1974646 RepID=A0A2M6W5Y7_9BACT|nr:MAG: UMP kinase [Candidatus Magasanikbacteria bacterium CG10_big_fil_rev_8_21_14_0_10_36_32]